MSKAQNDISENPWGNESYIAWFQGRSNEWSSVRDVEHQLCDILDV